MLAKRIIPCLDIMNGKVVKGVHFLDLTPIGDPVAIAKEYERQQADEVVFLDITATHEGRETVSGLIERAAAEMTIPFTVGGGIRTLDDFRKILDRGADKASVNTSAVTNPQLISEASAEFGKSCVVVAIDAKIVNGRYHVFIKGGREDTGLELAEWAKECERLGAGELLVTSMDGDGTQNGYDIPMIRAVTQAVRIPVIASGGCGEISHIIDVFTQTDCDAALVASLFHYAKAAVGDVKIEMERNGLPCRK
ncbi:MAG: imidazole glycerol phosphate synthase subunit HisF [Clostridia bacterium]|nr:imidazole glycerol phosphate synthase subunit HisF [Clostridia bacterium]